MKRNTFPLFKTKMPGVKRGFRLEDPVERKEYFQAKAGAEIALLRADVAQHTFVGFLLGKKNAGKGTYSKLFMEAVGPEHVAHVSVGDIVRGVHKGLGDAAQKQELEEFLRRRYRGFVSLEKVFDVIVGRDTATLMPTELILALVEREIDKIGHKAVFIDGFPRNLDQISSSLYFRALMGYRDDPDFFVFIDVPEAVIDERMKYRVICPTCQSPRNSKLLRTKEIGYDEARQTFFLMCENPGCANARMSAKEGDELGIEAIRERIELDEKVMATLLGLEGVPKVFLRNAVPIDAADEYVDDYEITPAYRYERDAQSTKVRVTEERWVVSDDEGKPSYSLMPAPVAVAFLKQTASALGLL